MSGRFSIVALLACTLAWSCVDRTRTLDDTASVGAGSRPSSRPARSTNKGKTTEQAHDKDYITVHKEAFIPDTQGFSELLGKIVKDGLVDYALLRQDSKALDEYLAAVAGANLKGKDKKSKLAFYINAYNATVLRLVMDNIIGKGKDGADIEGVLALARKPGFFDREDALVGGKRMSLNALESLGRALGDPRIHFAVNCASLSCPVLASTAWSAASLDEDLNRATKKYFESKHGLQIKDGKVYSTQLLEWYAKDFAGVGGPLEFLKAHAPAKVLPLLGQGIAGYLEYDWSLNRWRSGN